MSTSYIMPPNQKIKNGVLPINLISSSVENERDDTIRCAILGCGMMGQEHISYIQGYEEVRIDYLVDPFQPSLDKAEKIMKEYQISKTEGPEESSPHHPIILRDEDELMVYAHNIDLLVIATPNYLHTDSLIKWGKMDITILVEKPVAVSTEQHQRLRELTLDPSFKARVWVAMEYRYIPAIAKLLSLIPDTIGDLKMVTIRENRYPFLHKVGSWNRDPEKTGDTLVEKCCHFFDLFRLITKQEVVLPKVRALAQRGLNYQDEDLPPGVDFPILDSAYVSMPFNGEGRENKTTSPNGRDSKNASVCPIGCLELCMYAEGSRHQEEIIVTGTKVRMLSAVFKGLS